MPTEQHSLPVRFGRYELVDHIATGGMAEVFLARSFGVRGFQKHVVVKKLRPGLAHTPRMVRLFVQEARISAGLAHPNIAQIHELGAVAERGGETHYIAMEYIHGQDLTRVRRALESRGRTMPVALAVHCAVRVLRALAYAHGRSDAAGRPLGLVHRDVSPHNVLASFQGEVKLVDFGIARLEGDVAGGQLPGGGKYAYMSPEQASGAPLDGRSDVFSCGILLWELLVGHRLFQHPDPQEKLRRVKAAEVPDPRDENPDVPEALWGVLARMLAQQADDRPTAAEAEEALQAVRFDLGLRGEGAGLGQLVSELFPEEARRDPGGLDLDGLVADLARLGGPRGDGRGRMDSADDLTGSMTGTLTGSMTGTLTGSSSASPHGDETGTGPEGDPDEITSLPALRGLSGGERKAVVVVVAEVIGLDTLSLVEEPEVLARTHYRLLRRVRRVVDRHGGWLDRFQDDVLTIFFGIPRTAEHDLDRALACAAQLVRELRRQRRRGLPLHLAVGVHQGELSLARRGGRGGEGRNPSRRLRYLARGDTTTLPARLARAADRGEVRVSERVATMARERFLFESRPPVLRRDGAGDRSFRLIGRDTQVRDTPGRWLPRGDELERLGRGLRRVAEGRRELVVIRGPAGVGKSRLVQEFRDLARSRGVPVYAARAVPYTADRPLATLRDLVGRVMGLPLEASPGQVEAGLSRLAELGLDPADVAVIASLFGLERLPVPDLEGVGGDELIGAAGRVVARIAEGGPVLLAVEDGQHLSQLELRVVRNVLDATASSPILLLLTVRGQVPPLLAPFDQEILLGPLAPDLQHALAAQLLGARELELPLFDLVQRRAEGNPRYLEAVVQALVAEKRVTIEGGRARLVSSRDLPPLPEGLEALVAARIDALEPPVRQVLQVAAVLGAAFPLSLLRRVAGDDEVEAALGELEDKGLLRIDGDSGSFASELVLGVAEHGMLATRRRELHGLVASAMELRDDPDVGWLTDLARHCAAAGRLLDAARYADIAGDQLRRVQSNDAAVRHWNRAVGWLVEAQDEGAPAGACLRGEAVLHGKLGEVRMLLGEADAAERHLQAGLDAASECEDVELEARAMVALGRLFRSRADPARARANLELALEHADRPGAGGDWVRAVAVEALELLGLLDHDQGLDAQAVERFTEALDRAGDDDGLAARALLGLARRYVRRGEEARALTLLDEARTRATAARDRILLGRVVNNVGLVHHGAGRFDQALACFQEARELRRDTGYRYGEAVNLHNIGDTWLRQGSPGRAWAAFERSRDLAVAIGWAGGVVLNELWMSWLEASRGNGDPTPLREASRRARQLGDLETALTGQWLLGRLLGDRGQQAQAREILQAAIDEAEACKLGVLARDLRASLAALPPPA